MSQVIHCRYQHILHQGTAAFANAANTQRASTLRRQPRLGVIEPTSTAPRGQAAFRSRCRWTVPFNGSTEPGGTLQSAARQHDAREVGGGRVAVSRPLSSALTESNLTHLIMTVKNNKRVGDLNRIDGPETAH
jgi:hypothetical protein